MDVRTFASGRLGFCQLFLRVEAPPVSCARQSDGGECSRQGASHLWERRLRFFPELKAITTKCSPGGWNHNVYNYLKNNECQLRGLIDASGAASGTLLARRTAVCGFLAEN